MNNIYIDLQKYANIERAKQSLKFFKTKKGEYGEHDKFLGLTVPNIRIVAKKYNILPFADTIELLHSPIHEHRLCALIVLVNQFKHSNQKEREEITTLYLVNKKYVNNWDLVDLSCHHILGQWCYETEKSDILTQMAHSKNLWEKRIAIVSTYAYIKQEKIDIVFQIARILLYDTHDLIHKAVGWMLREAGKRDVQALEKFLYKYAPTMPRTALRYSIEKFSPEKRALYMKIGV